MRQPVSRPAGRRRPRARRMGYPKLLTKRRESFCEPLPSMMQLPKPKASQPILQAWRTSHLPWPPSSNVNTLRGASCGALRLLMALCSSVLLWLTLYYYYEGALGPSGEKPAHQPLEADLQLQS